MSSLGLAPPSSDLKEEEAIVMVFEVRQTIDGQDVQSGYAMVC